MIYPFSSDMEWFVREIDRKSFDDCWNNWENYVIRVSMYNKEIQGFSIIHIVRDAILILRLAVHPYSRNKGIGRELVENVEVTARKNTKKMICAHIHEQSVVGIKFLSRLGFKATGLQRNFYGDRDAVNFLKEMN